MAGTAGGGDWPGRFAVQAAGVVTSVRRRVTVVAVPGVVDHAFRVLNAWVLDPAMLRLAGRRHWYAAVLRHTERRSGRRYATPIVAEPVEGGFLTPLLHGTEVDWLRNVMAAGQAVVEDGGVSHRVVDPQLLDAEEALSLVPTARQVVWTLLGVEQFLRVRIARGQAESAEPFVPALVQPGH
jgi:hypothetical protein